MLTEPEPRAAIEETRRILAGPLNNLSQEIPPELTAALDENIFYFSGFKTHHELVEASRMLKDDNGGFKPFNRFLKDVETINNTYNRNYLKAEYNFATASTQMAVKWKEWEADGDDYDLQYRTAGDDRVREEHAALDGVTLPPSDPFWNHYLPPNGWNCRCTTVQVRRGKYPQSNSEEAIARGQACTAKPKQQIFRFNPGKQEKIFPPKHPYYKAPGEVGKAMETIKQHKEENRKEYERLKKDPDYTDVHYDEATGGVKATHVGHFVHEKEEKFFKNLTKDGEGLTSTQLENSCQDILFRHGNSAILCNENIKNATGGNDVALDLILNKSRMDIASITENKDYYMYPLSRKNHQLGKYNHLEYVTEPADSVCLYFHDSSMYSAEKVMKGFDEFKKSTYKDKETGELKHHTVRIKHIYCVINEGEGRIEMFDVE